MKTTKIISLILVLLGMVLFLVAMYAKERVSEAKKSIRQTSGLLPGNPVNLQIEKALEEKISSYDKPIYWGMVGGIAFVIIGVGVFFFRKR